MRNKQITFKVPYAYLGKTPEAGTAQVTTTTPEKAEKLLQLLRPKAIIGKAYK